jgi:hypothetical protein
MWNSIQQKPVWDKKFLGRKIFDYGVLQTGFYFSKFFVDREKLYA